MFKICNGGRRTVFLIGKYAIKIPRFKRWVSFIQGVRENLEERYWYSADGSRKRDPKRKWSQKHLAEIYWADRFGFIVVMERVALIPFADDWENSDNWKKFNLLDNAYKEKVMKDLEEIKKWAKGLPFYDDIKYENVGYIGERMVVIDYGFSGGTRDCYLGT